MLEHIVEFDPAYDKRPKKPGEPNYGIHGITLRMVLKGELGAVQFILYTNWMLDHVKEELMVRHLQEGVNKTLLECFYQPMPADVGYHSIVPRYEDQISRDCAYVKGGKCYYDGSGLAAERVYEILLTQGSEGVWKYLEEYYKDTFGGME